MFQLNTTPGRTAFVNNREMLFFSGYAYLGMNHIPEFVDYLKKGVELYGAVYPSSRISNTQLDLFAETEKILSELTQTSDTILMQSGFTAGKASIECIAKNRTIFQSSFCHPAIRINPNASLTFSEWANETVQNINSNQYSKPPVIISDAVNQLTATVYDFSFLHSINQNIICVIDDSHGIGILGKNGEGISSQLPRKDNIEYIITYSLSKAMNVQAGAISCSNKSTADSIRKSSWYAATTPPSPASLYAFCRSQNIYQQQRLKLDSNKKMLQHAMASSNDIHFHKDLPIFIFPEEYDEDYFAKQDIIISSFAYPDPSGKKINRAVINALHSNEDLQQLANAIFK
jgi:7-keto-8-aminopelargonate synthetase-like enzyme